MMKMLDKAYDMVKPDLIVFTGDNVLGNHFRDARTLTPLFVKTKEAEFKAMEIAIEKLLRPVEDRKIPFSMIYGNHDIYKKYNGISYYICWNHLNNECQIIVVGYSRNIACNQACNNLNYIKNY